MSKYRTYERQAAPIHRKDPHPIWRGIGCLIMLLVPALSLGISSILVQLAPSFGIQLPYGLLGPPLMPEILFRVPGLVGILNWIQGRNNLYAILIGTFAVAIVLTSVLALGYAIVYRIIGPPRYTKYDAPPPNIKVKRYKR
jgi:hypothetical protein